MNLGSTTDGETPLLAATKRGSAAMVALLITEGSVDVNKAATAKGLTPLYIAAEDNHIEIVNLLLKGKADVNSKTDIGWTPLFIGIFHGHTDVVKLLLQEGGADADLPRNDGWTPLMVAAHKGRTAEVELLLALGNADVHEDDGRGMTALVVATNEEIRGMLRAAGAE